MLNFVNQIYEFNKKAGLLDKPYDDFLESSFQIEEALEGFNLKPFLANINNASLTLTPKELSRDIMSRISDGIELSDVDRLDKACDAIVFAVGSIAKLGLNPNQIAEAISIVMEANLAKLDMPKDEFGKLMKPDGFVGPEPKLQALLDMRPTC